MSTETDASDEQPDGEAKHTPIESDADAAEALNLFLDAAVATLNDSETRVIYDVIEYLDADSAPESTFATNGDIDDSMVFSDGANVLGFGHAGDIERDGTVLSSFSVGYLDVLADTADLLGWDNVVIEAGQDIPLLVHDRDDDNDACFVIAPRIDGDTGLEEAAPGWSGGDDE